MTFQRFSYLLIGLLFLSLSALVLMPYCAHAAEDTTVFFLVEYEAYEWNPCSGGNCLAIYCGEDGMCDTPAKQFFVKTLDEVREIIDRNGTDHLLGMYRIDYDRKAQKADVIELKLVPSFEVKTK